MTAISVVIPSNRERVLTTDSVPDRPDVEVQVRRDEGLNRARNAGVANASHDVVLILDDDLVFEGVWFERVIDRIAAEPRTVVTVRGTGILPQVSWPDGFTPGMGRVMGFRKDVWRDAGGFPVPCSHGGDTDFLMSAFEAGYTVVGIEHEFEHRDDDEDHYNFLDNIRWLATLMRRHPRLVGPRLPAILVEKLR